MDWKLLCIALMGLELASLPGAVAHGINSQGVATVDGSAFRAWVSADPVPGNDTTLYQCRVVIVPTSGPNVVDTAFRCRSNFNHPATTDPTFVSNELFADGSESGTDFRIDGIQNGPVVHATGHYLQYSLVVSVNLVPA